MFSFNQLFNSETNDILPRKKQKYLKYQISFASQLRLAWPVENTIYKL